MNAEEVYALLNKKIKKGGITDDQIKTDCRAVS